jgi:hypothetical protein
MTGKPDMEYRDEYLSKLLKNWAATHQPPEAGRSLLLLSARTSQVKRKAGGWQLGSFWSVFGVDVVLFRKRESYWLGPITQSRAWTFHLATTNRFAY